ncbi:MAG: hypothetical protein ACP5RT_03125, partial [Candidatus Micrarchaeia archaeon]
TNLETVRNPTNLFVGGCQIKSHMAIKQTPAEKAGLIEYYGCKTEKSRWQYLIEQATKSVYFYLTSLINRIL